MKPLHRPPVICQTCKARIHWGLRFGANSDPDVLFAGPIEPPPKLDRCPRCSSTVETTAAYPTLPDFPPNFDLLKAVWKGFAPRFEFNRRSPEDDLGEISHADLKDALNDVDAMNWLKQRLFYRGTVCFYRALELFLAVLTLQRHSYKTWSKVTAYYSRFYSIQAILNLFLTSFVGQRLIYCTGHRIHVLPKKEWPSLLSTAGSHERWWLLMETLRSPEGLQGEEPDFVLSRAYYDPHRRNTVNYDFSYKAGGFPELNWFDTDVVNMMFHFGPSHRPDHDITDADRFFCDEDPASADFGNFAGDPIQVVWLSLFLYLQTVSKLQIKQNFISTGKIAALTEVHLFKEYPNNARGILLETTRLLGDDFDVDAWIQTVQGCRLGQSFWNRRGT